MLILRLFFPVPRAELEICNMESTDSPHKIQYFRWEKFCGPKHVKYYEARIEQDLFGEWIVMCRWGRVNTKLGNRKCVGFGDYVCLEKEIIKIHKRRLSHEYALITGAIPTI